MNLRKTIIGALALIALPFGALAAPLTNTQLLNKAFLGLNQSGPGRVEGELRYGVEVKPYGLNSPDKAMTMGSKIGIRVRTVPNSADPKKLQNEGKLSVELTGSTGDTGFFPMTWTGAIIVEWKIVDDMVYFRVANLPPALIEYVKNELAFDPSSLIGLWIGTGLSGNDFSSGLSRELEIVPGASSFQSMFGLSAAELKQLEAIPLLSVVYVEKTWKNASGEDIRRIRFRVNPYFITAMQNLEIRKVPYNTYRTQAVSAIYKRYAELRKQLARFTFVTNINVQKVRVERLEFGGSIVENQKNKCAINAYTKKYECLLSSIMTLRMNGGLSFLVDDGTPVIPPFPWVTPEQFGKMIEELMPKPEPLPPMDDENSGNIIIQDNSTETLTNPGM